MKATDSDLMNQFRAGGRGAFDELVNRYTDRIYSFVLRLSGDAAVAEDAAQETFIKVWKNRARFKDDRPFKPWIFAIARNATLDIMRKRKDHAFSKLSSEDESFEEGIADESMTVAEGFDRNILSAVLEETMKNLTDYQRTAVLLHDVEGMTFEEAGKAMGKPMNTVKSHYRRAIQSLRAMLEQRGH